MTTDTEKKGASGLTEKQFLHQLATRHPPGVLTKSMCDYMRKHRDDTSED